MPKKLTHHELFCLCAPLIEALMPAKTAEDYIRRKNAIEALRGLLLRLGVVEQG